VNTDYVKTANIILENLDEDIGVDWHQKEILLKNIANSLRQAEENKELGGSENMLKKVRDLKERCVVQMLNDSGNADLDYELVNFFMDNKIQILDIIDDTLTSHIEKGNSNNG